MPATPSPSSAPPASGHLVGIVLLALLIALAYSNTLRVPLLFDDEVALAKNESIRHLATAFMPPKNGEPVTGRPLLNATFALNYAASGLSLPALHITNILIHFLSATALFGVIRRTLGLPFFRGRFSEAATRLAWLATAFWALHPLQTESVTYLSQRAESLVGLFYLSALYAFIRSNEPGASAGWTWLTFLLCAAGVATKEVMATFPIVAVLYERVFLQPGFRDCWRRNGRLYLSLAGTWLLLGWFVASGGVRGNTVGFTGHVTWWNYLCTQSYAIIRYLWLSVLPASLSFDYGSLVVKDPVLIAACSLGVLSLLAVTLLALRRHPATGFLAVWFFVILAPTSSVIPVITQTVAEHRMYLSLAALTTGATLLLWRFAPRFHAGILAILVLVYGYSSFARNHTYQSETGLWEDCVAKRPDNPRSLNNLGLLYVKQHRYTEGLAVLRRVLELDPGTTETNYNLGYALARLGRDEESLKYYEAALKAKADNLEALVNYAAALLRLGRIQESITFNRTALGINPDQPEANNNLGQALVRTGSVDAGLAHLRRASDMDESGRKYFDFYVSTLVEAGRQADAIAACESQLRKRPGADLFTFLGVLYAKNRDLEKAREAFVAALHLEPNHAEAQQNLKRAEAILRRNARLN